MGNYARLLWHKGGPLGRKQVLLESKGSMPLGWFLPFRVSDLVEGDPAPILSKPVGAALALASERVEALSRVSDAGLVATLRGFLDELRTYDSGSLVLDPDEVALLYEDPTEVADDLRDALACFDDLSPDGLKRSLAEPFDVSPLARRLSIAAATQMFGFHPVTNPPWLRGPQKPVPTDYAGALSAFFGALGVAAPLPDYESNYGRTVRWSWELQLLEPHAWHVWIELLGTGEWRLNAYESRPPAEKRYYVPSVVFRGSNPGALESWGRVLAAHRGLLTLPREGFQKGWRSLPGGDALEKHVPRDEVEAARLLQSLPGRLLAAMLEHTPRTTAAALVDVGELGSIEITLHRTWFRRDPDRLTFAIVPRAGNGSWCEPVPGVELSADFQRDVARELLTSLAAHARGSGFRIGTAFGQHVVLHADRVVTPLPFLYWFHAEKGMRAFSRHVMGLGDDERRGAYLVSLGYHLSS